MKNILMTASVYSHIRNFHLPYLQEFHRLGWETHVGCAKIPSDAPYMDKVIEIPFEKRMSSISNFHAMELLKNQIRLEQYDLIVTHTTLAAFFTRLAVKGMKKRPRLINVMHGYLFDDNTPFFKEQLLLNAERLTAPETDLLLVMNDWDYQTAKKYRLGKRIEKIPGMGVDFKKLDSASDEDAKCLREKLGIPSGALVLLYPAELSKRKSQHVLIEAMQYLPQNVWLVLCGEGECTPACRILSEKLHVNSRVLFPGQVTNIGAWYRMADILAASSRSEGLPFNVMEAMHMGLPVIASAVKGHTDLIRDGENGLLYPYGDAKVFSRCVERLMLNAILRQKIRERAAHEVAQYELSVVFPQIMAKYQGII